MRPKTEIGTEPKWIRNELFLRRPAFYLSRCHYLFIQSTLKLNWSDGGHMERNGMFLSVSGRLNLPSLLNMSPLKCLLTEISSQLTLAANAAHTRTLLMIMLPTVSHVTQPHITLHGRCFLSDVQTATERVSWPVTAQAPPHIREHGLTPRQGHTGTSAGSAEPCQ